MITNLGEHESLKWIPFSEAAGCMFTPNLSKTFQEVLQMIKDPNELQFYFISWSCLGPAEKDTFKDTCYV